MNKELEIKVYGKLNLGLDVLGVLENGYHEVCMIMQTVDLYDTLKIERVEEAGIQIQTDSENIPCDSHNLAYKAAALMFETYKITGGIKIEIKKRIPVAAGMAGGSADCAGVLRGINQLFDLSLSTEQLEKIGVKLGADVPYCISGGTVLAEGIGEKLTSISQPPECFIVLAKPNMDISTKYVYEHLKLEKIEHPDIIGLCQAIEQQDIFSMCKKMGNVLESVTGVEYPEIGRIENIMRAGGALCAMMSGSGPTVFGVFLQKDIAENVAQKIKDMNVTQEVFTTCFIKPGKE